jgi:hypothetical protein
VEAIDECNKTFHPDKMPLLSQLMTLPTNDPSMTICAVLQASFSWWDRESMVAERIIMIPVSCSLANIQTEPIE